MKIHCFAILSFYVKSGLKEGAYRNLYQTIYAIIKDSVAAPTARFHFTKSPLTTLKKIGSTNGMHLTQCRTRYFIIYKKRAGIYIYPFFGFRFVDLLITNFHLPKSTLLVLISTFVSSPNTIIVPIHLVINAKYYRFQIDKT